MGRLGCLVRLLLKMMNFVLKMMDFRLTMMDSILKMSNFAGGNREAGSRSRDIRREE